MANIRRIIVFLLAGLAAGNLFDICQARPEHNREVLDEALANKNLTEETIKIYEAVKDILERESFDVDDIVDLETQKQEIIAEAGKNETEGALKQVKRSTRSCPCKFGPCKCPVCKKCGMTGQNCECSCATGTDNFEKSIKKTVGAVKESVAAGAAALSSVFKKANNPGDCIENCGPICNDECDFTCTKKCQSVGCTKNCKPNCKCQPKCIEQCRPKCVQNCKPRCIEKCHPDYFEESQPRYVQVNEEKYITVNEPKYIKVNEPKYIKVNQPKIVKVNRPKIVKVNQEKIVKVNQPKWIKIHEKTFTGQCDDECIDEGQPKCFDHHYHSKCIDHFQPDFIDRYHPKYNDEFKSKSMNKRQPKYFEKLEKKFIEDEEPKMFKKPSKKVKDEFTKVKEFTEEFFAEFFGQIKLLGKSLTGIFEKLSKTGTGLGFDDKNFKKLKSSSSTFKAVIDELGAIVEFGPKFLKVLMGDEAVKDGGIKVPELPIKGDAADQMIKSLKKLEPMMMDIVDIAKLWFELYDFKSKTGGDSKGGKFFGKEIFEITEKSRILIEDLVKELLELTGSGGIGQSGDLGALERFDIFDNILNIAGGLPALIVEQLTGMGSAIGGFGDVGANFDEQSTLVGLMASTSPLFERLSFDKTDDQNEISHFYRALACPYENRANRVNKRIVEDALLGIELDGDDVVRVIMPDGKKLVGSLKDNQDFLFTDDLGNNCEIQGGAHDIDLRNVTCQCNKKSRYIM